MLNSFFFIIIHISFSSVLSESFDPDPDDDDPNKPPPPELGILSDISSIKFSKESD